jgi:septal ring factor EnvC (AmiA/AmiB activator)
VRQAPARDSKGVNTRYNQMVRGKHKNISNRSQCFLAPSEPSSSTTASPGYPNTPEKRDSDLNSHLMKMIEELKEEINNSLKIQENTSKQIEALKEETHKFLKEIQETQSKWQRN